MNSITAETNDTIRKLRPQAQVVRPMEGGVMNSTFVVDDEVFRFPLEQEGRPVLLYEAEVLGRLAGKLSLNISELKEVAEDGSYIILSYVPGETLSSEEIMAFTSEQKKLLAKTIVQCLHEINAALSNEQVKQLIKEHIPWQKPDDEFYKSILDGNTQSKYHQQYVSFYEKYAQHQKEVGEPKEIVVYGDFHYGNMLFNDKKELTGLIDFGDVNIGTVTTEFRQIYRLGPDIVEHMVSESGSEFGETDIELIKLLAIIHEIWVLMRTEGKEPPKDGRDKLAQKLLVQWLGKNWGEL